MKHWNNLSTRSCKELCEYLETLRSSDTAFIIGGGPSVQRLLPDPSVLPPENTIVLNNAYKLIPNALVCHFADDCWYQWNSTKLLETFKNPITTCTQMDRNVWRGTPIKCFEKKPNEIFTTNKDILTSANAGHQGIQLAHHIGFRKMVLFGFDQNPNEREQQWHDEHRRTTLVSNYTDVMTPGFKQLASYQDRGEFKVFNLNHDSYLKCFEFADLKDFIDI